jgi:raffinose/stachyose/melibiose transport system permease protein
MRQVPWILALPAIVIVLAFNFVAPLSAVYYAFTDWNGLSSPHWVGLANFRSILGGGSTTPLVNSLKFAAVVLVGGNVIGCCLALALHRTLKTRMLLRLVFFLPFVLSPLATAYIWQYIFTYSGSLNFVLTHLGLRAIPWLGDPTWAFVAAAIVLLWQFSGLAMVIYLAGLQAIPVDIEEAAAVDGATALYRFRRITLPMLAPAVTVSSTLLLIIGLRVFDQIYALTAGGPVNATQTLATSLYNQAFSFGRYGYGTALSVVLTVLVAGLVLTQLALLRRREARL